MNYSNREKAELFLDFLGITPSKREKLLNDYSEKELINLLGSDFSRLDPFLEEKIDTEKAKEDFKAFLKDLQERNIFAVCRSSKFYPEILKRIDKPPFALYCMGDLSLLSSRSIAIIGRRACRRKYIDITFRFAKELSEAGLTIVSGMADGCDSAAHRGTLENGGKTIAVLAGGFDHVYPQSNMDLFREIAQKGLVISERKPTYRALRYDFVLRNRIVAGISEGVLVTCAALRSGTLSTANFALDNGREIFAIPGDIDSEDSEGTNKLIKDLAGAMVTSPDDVLSVLKITKIPKVKKSEKDLDGAESLILDVLRDSELHINEIAQITGRDYSELAPILSVMEIKGLIERLPGNIYREKIVLLGR